MIALAEFTASIMAFLKESLAVDNDIPPAARPAANLCTATMSPTIVAIFLPEAEMLYWNDQISRIDIYNRSAYNSRQAMQNSTYLLVQV